LGSPRQQEWDIKQGISDEENSEAILSTPNFKKKKKKNLWS